MDKKIEEYNEFKNKFIPTQIECFSNRIFINGELAENDSGTKACEGETFVNVDNNLKSMLSRVLSPQFPMEFRFRGKTIIGIESVLQAIVFEDIEDQNRILNYEGALAHHKPKPIKNEKLYWQGEIINSNEEQYETFLDELFLAALENPSFKSALREAGQKYLLVLDENKTNMLSRNELEKRLNSLKGYVQKNYPKVQRNNESVNTL